MNVFVDTSLTATKYNPDTFKAILMKDVDVTMRDRRLVPSQFNIDFIKGIKKLRN